MGPSGIGKSTLLAAIAGHLDPSVTATGHMTLEGQDLAALTPETRGVGMIFQDPCLFPHLSLGDNLAFGLRASADRTARRAGIEAALETAGLAGLYEADPDTLSGGQKSRASLMRSLLAEPRALLMDEPFSALDMELRDEMRRFVFAHIRARNIPAVLVTHDPADAEAAHGPCCQLQRD
jgi:putative thiamine transport system ATP-binding protein